MPIGGHGFRRRAQGMRRSGVPLNIGEVAGDAKDVPAKEAAAEQSAWVSQPHVFKRRAKSAKAQEAERPQGPFGLVSRGLACRGDGHY